MNKLVYKKKNRLNYFCLLKNLFGKNGTPLHFNLLQNGRKQKFKFVFYFFWDTYKINTYMYMKETKLFLFYYNSFNFDR